MGELTLKDLFAKKGKYTFLVGAGISRDPPSNLPLGREMMEVIIRYTCAESEVEKILGLENLRFEQLVEIVRDYLDPELKLIDYYGLCDKPNTNHFFLVEMMKRGHYVLTTNFDCLIEHALMQSKVKKNRNLPVITEEDFKKYSDVPKVVRKGYFPVYKIHGSPHNIITNTSTKDSLVVTIQAFGSGKEGESVFQLEPHKRPVFESITNGRTLVIMGYSGSDDFDITPTLRLLDTLDQLIWIEHAPKGTKPIIQEFSSDIEISPKDKVGNIFQEVHRMGYRTQLVRVKMHTSDLGTLFIKRKSEISQSYSETDLLSYINSQIKSPDEYQVYQIPYEIYDNLSFLNNAERCARILLKHAQETKNQRWQSITLTNIGRLLHDKGEWDEARRYYKEALAIDEQLGDLRGKSKELTNIGILYHDKGEWDEAMRYYKEALAIDEQLGDL
ncbi:MAG: tetratricopeptide repeat protein, partial [Candidatus Lokiarchaeota archaeon]|nr:tetratricopeptide repeat protein [Candidatus Lokiarchaeota archaeon]